MKALLQRSVDAMVKTCDSNWNCGNFWSSGVMGSDVHQQMNAVELMTAYLKTFTDGPAGNFDFSSVGSGNTSNSNGGVNEDVVVNEGGDNVGDVVNSKAGTSGDSGNSALSTGAIVAIVVAAIVFLIFLVVLKKIWDRRQKSKRLARKNKNKKPRIVQL
jgi:hypothetical protein